MKLSSEQVEAIDAYLFAGNRNGAVREYRRITGAGWREALVYKNQRLKILHKNAPSHFIAEPQTPSLDTAILQQIEVVPDAQMRGFRELLKQMQKMLYGCNYEVSLSVNAVKIGFAELPVEEVIVKLFPDATPWKANISAVSAEDVVEGVAGGLLYEGKEYAGPRFTDRSRVKLRDQLFPSCWQNINELVSLESSRCYSYRHKTGLPGYYVYWLFAYLIHHVEAKQCVVITGMASD